MEEPSGRTDNGIPTWQGQEAVRVGEGDPSHPGCCSHCPGLFSLSSQCSEFLWVENLISFVHEHIYWVHMKDNHKLPVMTLTKHGQHGPWVGTILNPITRGILQ